ncbi:MAG: hypothetical protein A2W93_13650 [Bacteroidetes bacterium GWF2_43_63]|nr:MAG: hypothetical protein A2W94_03845 [Bacteroidetes bacterium GWE2_42_42]OFY55033.1 MAG: hypothetical protein A2W93_13650 [Bacteroidetes bacterium GWF2_43_63]HBG69570.1 hypothetical protein [Bacteroidales bacterium]HCB60691.1 hypothetical protein [Bacteroidales bacterium]HCY24005.1 hypothetical protein [Bacteroidales bacterium]
MKLFLSLIFSTVIVFAVCGQKGIGLEGRIFASDNNMPVVDQKVFVVFESSAQPYVQNLNNLITTASDGSFSLHAPSIPTSIIPLKVMVYTYDCDFQRKGYLITFNQNDVWASDVDISICMGVIDMPSEPLQISPSDNTCPAFFGAEVNDSLKRKYLIEDYKWTINNQFAGQDQSISTLLTESVSNIKVTQTFTDSLTGFVFDSIQFTKSITTPATDFHILGGTVFSGSVPTTTGKAVLLGHSNTSYFAIDTCYYSQYGYFYFSSVPRCNYSVRIIEADNIMQSTAIPTYLGSELSWESAVFANLTDDNFNANITLAQQQFGAGICEISGYINDANPAEFDILLYNENMIPVSFRHCDPNGNFHFNGIPYGTYRVFTEKFGVASMSETVLLSMSNPSAYISLNTITQIDESAKVNFAIYPNPAADYLQLTPAPEGEIHITSVEGKEVMTTSATDGVVDVRQLSAGMYFLQTSLDGQPVTVQFVISRY